MILYLLGTDDFLFILFLPLQEGLFDFFMEGGEILDGLILTDFRDHLNGTKFRLINLMMMKKLFLWYLLNLLLRFQDFNHLDLILTFFTTYYDVLFRFFYAFLGLFCENRDVLC